MRSQTRICDTDSAVTFFALPVYDPQMNTPKAPTSSCPMATIARRPRVSQTLHTTARRLLIICALLITAFGELKLASPLIPEECTTLPVTFTIAAVVAIILPQSKMSVRNNRTPTSPGPRVVFLVVQLHCYTWTSAALSSDLSSEKFQPAAVWQAYSTGVLKVVLYNTNGVAIGNPVQYPLTVHLHDEVVAMTNAYPDGSGQWTLLCSNVVVQIAIATNLTLRNQPPDTIPRPQTATVIPTHYSHAGLTSDAFVWLAFFGGDHLQNKQYLKPPHFRWDEVAAWLTAASYTNLLSGEKSLLQSVTWTISLGSKDFKRAKDVLPRNSEAARVDLRRARRSLPPYPAGLVCGTYVLLESNIIGGVMLPKRCEARGFDPWYTRDMQLTNKLLSVRTLELEWSRSGQLPIAEDMELPTALLFRDLRGASAVNNGLSVLYMTNRLTVVSTNSQIYQEALIKQKAIVSSASMRGIVRVVIVSFIAVIVAAGLWALRGCHRGNQRR